MCSGGLLVAAAALLATRTTRAQHSEPNPDQLTTPEKYSSFENNFTKKASKSEPQQSLQHPKQLNVIPVSFTFKANTTSRYVSYKKGNRYDGNISSVTKPIEDPSSNESTSGPNQSGYGSEQISAVNEEFIRMKGIEKKTMKTHDMRSKDVKKYLETFETAIKKQITPFRIHSKSSVRPTNKNYYLIQLAPYNRRDNDIQRKRNSRKPNKYKDDSNAPRKFNSLYSTVKYFRPRHKKHANYRKFMNTLCFENLTESEYDDFIQALDTMKDHNDSNNSKSELTVSNDNYYSSIQSYSEGFSEEGIDMEFKANNAIGKSQSLYRQKHFKPEKYFSHKISPKRRDNGLFIKNEILRKIVQTSSSFSNEAHSFQENFMNAFKHKADEGFPHFRAGEKSESIYLKKLRGGNETVQPTKVLTKS